MSFKKMLILISFFVVSCGNKEVIEKEESKVVYKIGDSGPAGGIIFYIDEDDLYSWTYLEASLVDQSTGVAFDPYDGTITGADETSIGMGKSNTLKIVETEGVNGFAANICDELSLGGKLDWFLPSVDELELMYNKKDIIGGFIGNMYWSSTEAELAPGSSAIEYSFTSGDYSTGDKGNPNSVRCIRSF